jgi:hypothetical protein
LAVVKAFREALRHHQLKAIRKCLEDFNLKGGAIVKLQSGKIVYFARAVLLAIYADHPAAVKCSLTGSACPACYTQRTVMSEAPGPTGLQLRTEDNMSNRRRRLLQQHESGATGAKQEAQKRARRVGVKLRQQNGWSQREGGTWIFGPNPVKDNIYQCLPQVTLHGMDEGLTAKLCRGILALALHYGEEKGYSATKVQDVYRFVILYIEKSLRKPIQHRCQYFKINFNSFTKSILKKC